jgi:hypothetical protein
MRTLIFLFAFFLGSTNISFAGASPEHVFSDEELLRNKVYNIIVAEVIEVDDKEAKNSNPPKVVLSVSQVLRGNWGHQTINAVWLPIPHDIDYGGGDAKQRLEEWESIPMIGPKTGEKMILAGKFHDLEESSPRLFFVSPRLQFPYSEEKKQWILNILNTQDQQ